MVDETPADTRFDMERLDAALSHIEANPETWNQREWRCESGMCLAGWIVELNGDKWASDLPVGAARDLILVPEGTPGSLGVDTDAHYAVPVPKGMALMSASSRARQLLRLPHEHDLFAADNSLAALREMREEMAAGLVPRGDDSCDCELCIGDGYED